VDGVKQDLQANQEEINGHMSERDKGEKTCAQLKRSIGQCKQVLTELRAEAENDKSPDISALEEDRDRVAEDLENLQHKREKLTMDIGSARQVEQMQDEMVETKRVEWQNHLGRQAPLNEEMDQLHKDFANVKTNKNKLNAKMEAYTGRMQEVDTEMRELTSERDKYLEKAKKMSDVPPFKEGDTMRNPPAIHRELTCTQESIKRQEESQEPKEVVMRKYKETNILYTQLTGQIDELAATIKYLDISLRYRKKGFFEMRGAIVQAVKNHFTFRLRSRNYQGKLNFDHKEHTLEIKVNPNAGNKGHNGGDDDDEDEDYRVLKTLSGGEKSFCTVSLVLAFWDDMTPPFRILDEFDVFMDSINRRIAIDLIINYAKEARKFQYMFLTPLNLEHLNDEKEDVQVIRFEKNQG